MIQYLIKRFLFLIPTLLGVCILVFSIIHLIPGDPAVAMLGEHATPQAVTRLRKQLGLNRPLYVQFGKFIKGIFTLNLGRSIQTNEPALQEVLHHYPATIELAAAAMITAIFFGFTLGVTAACFPNTWIDYIVNVFSLTGISMPIFWLGLLFLLLFASHWRLFPFSGRIFPGYIFPTPTHFYIIDSLLTGNFQIIKDVLGHLILPSLTLSTIPLAILTKTVRGSLLDVLHQEYIRTAYAKGVSRWKVIWKHALKNAFIPVVTIAGLQFGYLLGGAILTETVFGWPGIGRLVVEAVKARDYPVLQAAVLLIAFTFVFINTLTDLIYAYTDPRIHYT
jgi:peptide/nickel transport system permease protein